MSTLLIVDDDILFLQALCKQMDFAQIGFDTVLTATSAAAAKQHLMASAVDVLLCDIEMPGGSGIDLVRWVCEEQYPVVVLLLTCYSSFTYAQEAIGLGVFDYLLKTIRPEALAERLIQAQKKRREIDWIDTYRQELSSVASDSDVCSRIRQYIEENIHTELTREQLGKALFMNPDYLARVFREQEGKPLNEYIKLHRIEHAKRLLRETDIPVAMLCHQVGYAYNTYFFNTFKKMTGLRPNEYRKKYGR